MPITERRALVLGGGGIAGVAWQLGLLDGLLELGVDLANADVVVGTSAGAAVGVVLRATELHRLYASQFDEVDAEVAGADTPDVAPFVAAYDAAALAPGGEARARAKLGSLALSVTDPAAESVSVERFASQLPSTSWPAGELRVTAVDALDGTFAVFDAGTGVSLVHAIAASCAIPGVYPAITINDRPYMDGGMRSSTNADVAADCDRILVVACGPEAPQSSLGPTLPQAVETLRDSAAVLVIEADAHALAIFGENSLMFSTRAESALAGRRQAAEVADEVRRFWSGE